MSRTTPKPRQATACHLMSCCNVSHDIPRETDTCKGVEGGRNHGYHGGLTVATY